MAETGQKKTDLVKECIHENKYKAVEYCHAVQSKK